tara:strand:+ start:1323 stop:2009 length:687 start_codon:yes stop_codon:yes gene_type:complete
MTIDAREDMVGVMTIAAEEAEGMEMRDVKREADLVGEIDVTIGPAVAMEEETGAKNMDQAAAMTTVRAVVMAEETGVMTARVADTEVVMSDATRALATATAQAEATVAPPAMATRTKSRDAQKLNAMTTVPVVEAEAMAGTTSDETRAAVDTTTNRAEATVEIATAQLAEATQATEATLVPTEASSLQAHHMAAGTEAQTISRAPLSRLSPVLVTLETRISSAWRLVC